MDPVTLLSSRIAAKAADEPADGAIRGIPFSERFRAALVDANRDLNAAEQSARELAEGRGDAVDAVLALSKAELSLRQVVTLRNRAFEAYQTIMRLQL